MFLQGSKKTVLTTRLNEAGVMSLSFSADGRFLVSSHRDGTVRLFDVATAQQKTILTGHTGEVWCVSFSPDGKTLASACGTELWLWDVTTRKYKSIDIDLEVYDEKQGGEKIFRNPVVFNLSFSPDGKTLATAHKDTTVRLWDVETRTAKTILKGHTDFVMSVCFAPDGKTLVSGSWDKTVRLWDVVTGHHKATLEGHNEIIKGVAFSPDGKTIASGSVDGTIFLWNLTSSDNTLDDAN
jgi:WD40 repeat protein